MSEEDRARWAGLLRRKYGLELAGGSSTSMTTLLIDADGLAFRAAAAVEKSVLWDDGVITSHSDLNEAIRTFEALIEECLEAVDTNAHVILAYSCPTRRYFRHEIYPDYKGNRRGGLPLGLPKLRQWSCDNYQNFVKPGLEADDVIGILATHPKLVKGPKVIVSTDKDLGQIPGLHLNPAALDEGVYRVSADYAARLLWTQALTGDSVDNYPGCPGVGPVKAAAILSSSDRPAHELVLEAYNKAGLTVEDMAVQVNLARILTAATYDFKRKEPILWQYPTP